MWWSGGREFEVGWASTWVRHNELPNTSACLGSTCKAHTPAPRCDMRECASAAGASDTFRAPAQVERENVPTSQHPPMYCSVMQHFHAFSKVCVSASYCFIHALMTDFMALWIIPSKQTQVCRIATSLGEQRMTCCRLSKPTQRHA